MVWNTYHYQDYAAADQQTCPYMSDENYCHNHYAEEGKAKVSVQFFLDHLWVNKDLK